jgi:hypothetical protein
MTDRQLTHAGLAILRLLDSGNWELVGVEGDGGKRRYQVQPRFGAEVRGTYAEGVNPRTIERLSAEGFVAVKREGRTVIGRGRARWYELSEAGRESVRLETVRRRVKYPKAREP